MEKLAPIRKFLSKGVNNKSLLYFGLVILAGLICLGFIWHFSKIPEIKEIPTIKKEVKTEKTLPEVLEDLTTPQPTKTLEVSEKIIKSLSAPKEKGVLEDVLKDLTAP